MVPHNIGLLTPKQGIFKVLNLKCLVASAYGFFLILAVPGGARKQDAGGDEAGGSFGSDRAEIFVRSLRLLIASDRWSDLLPKIVDNHSKDA